MTSPDACYIPCNVAPRAASQPRDRIGFTQATALTPGAIPCAPRSFMLAGGGRVRNSCVEPCATWAHGFRAAAPRRMAGLRRPQGRGSGAHERARPCVEGASQGWASVCLLTAEVGALLWMVDDDSGHEVVARSVENPTSGHPENHPMTTTSDLLTGGGPWRELTAEGTPRGGSRRWRRP
jgi:hypothetical protein